MRLRVLKNRSIRQPESSDFSFRERTPACGRFGFRVFSGCRKISGMRRRRGLSIPRNDRILWKTMILAPFSVGIGLQLLVRGSAGERDPFCSFGGDEHRAPSHTDFPLSGDSVVETKSCSCVFLGLTRSIGLRRAADGQCRRLCVSWRSSAPQGPPAHLHGGAYGRERLELWRVFLSNGWVVARAVVGTVG